MVLIHSKTGDIKTGAQGQAVYQGHYARQIRRVRSEKRGEVSKVQKARRVLFRQGLEWRKGLNRHDRLVLEQYAYQAHYTDDVGIILTWDRMAMKIALEVPTVAVVE